MKLSSLAIVLLAFIGFVIASACKDCDNNTVTPAIETESPTRASRSLGKPVHQNRTAYADPAHCRINIGGGRPFGVRDLLGGIVKVISQFVPEVGTVYSFASDIYDFFDQLLPKPDTFINIWDCIKADVENLIHKEITEQAYKDATENLKGITDSLGFYKCVFYHWAHNTTHPCATGLQGTHDIGIYDIGSQAMSFFNLLQSRIPEFGDIVQQDTLLPYYAFSATLYFSATSDILRYGHEWGIDKDVILSVRDFSRTRLKTYSAHVVDVLVKTVIPDCKSATDHYACVQVFLGILDGPVNVVPSWPILASVDIFSKSDIVLHNNYHSAQDPNDDRILSYDKNTVNSILFDQSRIYEQTVCTSPEDIKFTDSWTIGWDGGWGAGQPQVVFLPGWLHWTFGSDPICHSFYQYQYDPRCSACGWHKSDPGNMFKHLGGGKLWTAVASYPLNPYDSRAYLPSSPVIIGFDCPHSYYDCKSMLYYDESGGGFSASYNTYEVPPNYQIYNFQLTMPNNSDIAPMATGGGNGVVFEYAPVQKDFDSLAINGTTHVIPGASTNMEWAPAATTEAGRLEYLFSGHAAYSIGGSSDNTFYNINTPSGIPLKSLRVSAFIQDSDSNYSATIVHETATLQAELTKTDVGLTGYQGDYTLYVSDVVNVPSGLKKIAINGRKSLLGAIILSNYKDDMSTD
ncbi:hypothetical protein BGZ68_005330 [Mortierella alpina]|nr:hypothetical protein BGZ68_005330 [Mortierella alpina]